jgi:lipoprotein-releasing system ATP-binding protein
MAESAELALLSCRGLRRNFGVPGAGPEDRVLEVLKNIDLEIHSGEMVSIVGPSGVGKSTLLQILGTLDRPSGGTLTYGEQDVFALPEERLAAFRNQRIGFIFQFHHLLAEFSALENVMLPALIGGQTRREASSVAEPLLREVGLGERLEHKPGELSGGEQQRVAIARALVMDPAVVFADEPTGNLDDRTSDEIHQLLMSLNQRTGTAFVVVTHNMRFARLMQRHLLLSRGAIREIDGDEAPGAVLGTGKGEAS